MVRSMYIRETEIDLFLETRLTQIEGRAMISHLNSGVT